MVLSFKYPKVLTLKIFPHFLHFTSQSNLSLNLINSKLSASHILLYFGIKTSFLYFSSLICLYFFKVSDEIFLPFSVCEKLVFPYLFRQVSLALSCSFFISSFDFNEKLRFKESDLFWFISSLCFSIYSRLHSSEQVIFGNYISVVQDKSFRKP